MAAETWPALKSLEAPSWTGTHPLKQEADGLDFSKGRGPDEGGEATLVRLVDEVVAWQEGLVPLGCTPAHYPQSCGSGDHVGELGPDRGTYVDTHKWLHLYTRVGKDICTLTGHNSTHTHTPAHKVRQGRIPVHGCGHIPFLRCSFSWLSSPWAASWWMDRAGARERQCSHLSHPCSVP